MDDRSWWRKPLRPDIFVNKRLVLLECGLLVPAWYRRVSYVYDGPIYAYNGWTPDRVTVGVQNSWRAQLLRRTDRWCSWQ